jgi:hypothetical protein
MRKRLLLGYVIILGLIGMLLTEPVLPQSKPKSAEPEIYLAWCEYDVYGRAYAYACSTYGWIECKIINCYL